MTQINIKKLEFLLLLTFLTVNINAQNLFTGTNNFDSDWRFHRGGALGAENPDFNDSDWRVLDLPHDWSIEDLPGTNSP